MTHYPEYKESGLEWIGKIPSHWRMSRFKYESLFPVQYGLNIKSDFYIKHGIRFIRTTDITENGELADEGVYLDSENVEEVHLTQPNDFLISRSGTLGRTYLHQSEEKLAYAGYLVRFNFGRSGKSRFIFYFTKSQFFEQWIALNAIHTTIGNVNGQKYANLEIPLPSNSEQTQIANFLDHKTAQIDELIRAKERKIELLGEYRASLINQAVTKGLDPNVEMKPSGIDWVGAIPRHWATKRLKYLGESIIGLSYKPENMTDEEQGTLVLRASNIQDGKPSFVDNVYVDVKIDKKLIVKKGDILVCSRSGSRDLIGKNMTITEELEGVTFGVFMTVFRTKSFRFISHFLNSQVFKSYSGLFITSTINQLTIDTLNNFKICLPPENEQIQIADFLDHKTKQIDELRSNEEGTIKLLKEYRQSLISQAVTGKIDVRGAV